MMTIKSDGVFFNSQPPGPMLAIADHCYFYSCDMTDLIND